VGAGMLLYALYSWMTQDYGPLPIVDPNIFTQGNRDQRKINQKRLEELTKQLEQLRQDLAGANSKPNKTPDDKKLIDKIKAQINKVLDAMKKSETHGRTGKGS
jgi:parvulin-like peptidyl-prolyl isomerase